MTDEFPDERNDSLPDSVNGDIPDPEDGDITDSVNGDYHGSRPGHRGRDPPELADAELGPCWKRCYWWWTPR